MAARHLPMSRAQMALFERGARLQMNESIEMTIASLEAYMERYDHVAIAYSGGKDSTSLVTMVVWLILSGKIKAPKTLRVFYADTRQELLPLAITAMRVREKLEEHTEALAALGCTLSFEVVMAPLDRLFLVYMLGRGVPPPNNQTFRWCTEQIKILPMRRAIERAAVDLGFGEMVPGKKPGTLVYRGFGTHIDVLRDDGTRIRMRIIRADNSTLHVKPDEVREEKPKGKAKAKGPKALTFDRGTGEQISPQPGAPRLHIDAAELVAMSKRKLLVLTGVRQGESAIRDGRIAMSCGRNGAECGQGWYQETMPGAVCDTLAPLLHWRVCHIWAWLWTWAPTDEFGDWPTKLLAEAYGGRDGDDAAESQARTGCNGCPLAELDTALDGLLVMPQWAYLHPLKRLRPLYRRLREPLMRLRQPGGETRADGSLVENQHRMGPLKLAARLEALEEVIAIQAEINAAAEAQGRPRIDILNAVEEARIRELIDGGTWPQKWDGSEPGAEEEFEETYEDGSAQPLLFGALEEMP